MGQNTRNVHKLGLILVLLLAIMTLTWYGRVPANAQTVRPDRDQIAFIVSKNSNVITNLWVVNSDGSDPKALTDDSLVVYPAMSWAPDGTQIAFSAINIAERKVGIYLLNPETGELNFLIATHANTVDRPSYDVSWSPDGQKIAYIGDDGVYIITLANKQVARVVQFTPKTYYHGVTWTSDGKQITYVTGGNLYIVNVNDENPIQLTKDEPIQSDNPQYDSVSFGFWGNSIAWTPDGRIAFASPKKKAGGVYTMKVDGTDRQLFLNQFTTVSWSLDGKYVAVTETQDQTQAGIYLMNGDGSGKRIPLIKDLQALNAKVLIDPVWRPRLSSTPVKNTPATSVVAATDMTVTPADTVVAPTTTATLTPAPTALTNTDGLIVQDQVIGNGAVATEASMVTVNWIASIASGGAFDNTYTSGKPYTIKLSAGTIIPGLIRGIVGMHVGGKRIVTIPPSLGYGAKTHGTIPANATLIFQIELLDVK